MDKPRSIEEVSTPTTSVINLNVLEGLKKFQQADEPDFVTELIDLFLDDTAVQLESLKGAVAKNDVIEVRRLAHLVKGSSGNIGAVGLAELCQEMEKSELGTFAPDSHGQTLLLRLEEEFRQVGEAFKAQRQES